MMVQDDSKADEQYIFGDCASASAIFSRRTAPADASHVLPHLRPGLRVVDFGCGAGSITVGLAAAVAPGEVLGLDISEMAIAQARQQAAESGLTNLRLEVANICAVELPDEGFDVAHFSGVLAHLRQQQAALALAYRVLQPGGLIAAREPQKASDWFGGPQCDAVVLFNNLLIEDWKAAGGDPFLGRRLGSLLWQTGFERVEATPSYAPALSNRQAVGAFAARRLTEPEFAARVVRRGWITRKRLQGLADAIALWAASEDSVVGIAECMAIGWKPRR